MSSSEQVFSTRNSNAANPDAHNSGGAPDAATQPIAIPPGAEGRVVIFAPSPELTVTIEDHAEAGDIHIHAGGQGVWQARMVRALGSNVTLCATFAGETGKVLQHLLDDEGIEFVAVKRAGLGAAYIHDRRDGDRREVIETAGDPLSRHDLDELYGITLREGIESNVVLLSGPAGDHVLSPDVYRRLAADLRQHDCTVVVDLAGDRLDAALEGGVDIVKTSHEELLADGRIEADEPDLIIDAMRRIRDRGCDTVIVTRADAPLLMLSGEHLRTVTTPTMEIVDTRGAGDSFTAATAVGLARGLPIEDAVVLGASAGALNVTRHGLGTGDAASIHKFSKLVRVRPYGEPDGPAAGGGKSGDTSADTDAEHSEVAVSPGELAQLTL